MTRYETYGGRCRYAAAAAFDALSKARSAEIVAGSSSYVSG